MADVVGGARAATVLVDLCIQVAALQPSSAPGQPAQWSVTAWATGGNVANAAIALQVSPAGTGTAQFSFGCGSGNGTSTCTLGTVNAAAAHLQLQAQFTVPTTANVSSVSLTATGSATGLTTAPVASAPVTVTAAAPGAPVGGATLPVGVGTLPAGVPTPDSTLSPGGSVAGMLPTLAPTAPQASSTGGSGTAGGSRQVANTSTLPSGSSHVGVELIGLVALAAAFVLAVTRVSIRRPAGTGSGSGAGKGPGTAPLPPVKDEGPSGGTDGAE